MDRYLNDIHNSHDPLLQDSVEVDIAAPGGFILALQEPPWNTNTLTIPHLRGHFTFVDKSAKPKPRAAIYASKNLNLWACPEYTSKDMSTAIWVVNHKTIKKIYFVSLYSEDMSRHPAEARDPIVAPKLLSLVRRCRRENAEICILGDFNAHSHF